MNQRDETSPLISDKNPININNNDINNNNNNNASSSNSSSSLNNTTHRKYIVPNSELDDYNEQQQPFFKDEWNTSGEYLKTKTKFSFKKRFFPLLVFGLITAVLVFLVIFSLPFGDLNTIYNLSPFYIENDQVLLEMAMKSREYLLSIHDNTTISKLDFTILLSDPSGSWSLASYNGEVLSNATTLVYLPFLTAAVNWCINSNKDPHCLQMAAGPMLDDFSSIHAGILLDIITNAPNQEFSGDVDDPRFTQWMNQRKDVEDFLSGFDLLGNQTIINKVYPSNSGPIPIWGEEYIYNLTGPNYLNSYELALLMLYVTNQGMLPAGHSYMTDLMARQTFSQYTSLGFGLPPGSVLHTVLGTSKTDVNEVAHIILPNGKEMIMSVFSDGYQNFGDPPYQSSILGVFAENLLKYMDLTNGNPPQIIMSVTGCGESIQIQGDWVSSQSPQAYNGTFLYIAGGGGGPQPGNITWTIDIEQTGLYEVCAWFPGGSNHSSAVYIIQPNSTDEPYKYRINQMHYGARWILINSFYLIKGAKPTITISASGVSPSNIVVADSIKLTMWPSNNNIPGFASSNFIIPN